MTELHETSETPGKGHYSNTLWMCLTYTYIFFFNRENILGYLYNWKYSSWKINGVF